MSETNSSGSTKDRQFRKGQRVCRVEWRDGEPFLRFGTVTKVTKSTYYVDDKRTTNWHANGRSAIDKEYLDLFRDWSVTFGNLFRSRNLPEDWTIRDTVNCVCRVRRMQRRLFHRKARERKAEFSQTQGATP